MTKQPIPSTPDLWARFRFSVVGSLLSAPAARGELKSAIQSLADKTWTHPVTKRDVRFAAKTIEAWFYRARRERDDPVGVLRRVVRKDCGKVSLKPELIQRLAKQYRDYPHWTYQLHYDNLKALVKAEENLAPL
jgi:putative transposase